MTETRNVTVEGNRYEVTVSDNNEALSAASAAGRAIVGIWTLNSGKTGAGFASCLYLADSFEAVTEQLLERTVRRHLGLPWKIAETKRLLIREFTASDPLEPEDEEDGTGIFSDSEKRKAYIEGQYRFCECGLWALVEKKSGQIAGKAGITDGELGYHIYRPFRSQGYALEVCREILSYAEEELGLSSLMARIEKRNQASVRLAEKLGFVMKNEQGDTLIYEINLETGEG